MLIQKQSQSLHPLYPTTVMHMKKRFLHLPHLLYPIHHRDHLHQIQDLRPPHLMPLLPILPLLLLVLLLPLLSTVVVHPVLVLSVLLLSPIYIISIYLNPNCWQSDLIIILLIIINTKKNIRWQEKITKELINPTAESKSMRRGNLIVNPKSSALMRSWYKVPVVGRSTVLYCYRKALVLCEYTYSNLISNRITVVLVKFFLLYTTMVSIIRPDCLALPTTTISQFHILLFFGTDKSIIITRQGQRHQFSK
jgi:hypothetical protein